MNTRTPAAIAVLVSFALAVTGCTTTNAIDNLPKSGMGQQKLIDPGADNNRSVVDTATGEIHGGGGTVDQALARDLCKRVGDNVIEYSKISADNQGSDVWIDRLIDYKLLEDNRDTVQTPTGEDRSTVIKCHVVAHLSNGYRADMDIYELLASDGQSHVRWDNITNYVQDK
jgi:hypothetical protein